MNSLPLVVVDTNVLVSGLINPFGKPGLIVDMLLSRRLRLAFDDRILIEYREVLQRPRFGFSNSNLDRFFTIFPFQERVFPAPWPHPQSPDPSDTAFLEVASAATLLLTGNIRHFPPECRGGVQVFSPAEWLDPAQL